jgi:O-antigen/teichoic acid export membrane protein
MVWATVTIPQLVAVAIGPTLSRKAAESRSPRAVGALAAIVGLGSGIVSAIALRLVGSPLMVLAFGADFVAAVPLLERLLWALPGAFGAMTMGAVFGSWRMQRRTMAMYMVSLCLAVVLNLLWVPTMGAMAAATAAVAAYSLLVLLLVAVLFVQPPANKWEDHPNSDTVDS